MKAPGRQEPDWHAVVFDLGDTLVEYEGLPLSWENHYGDALQTLAEHLGVAAASSQIGRASDVLRRYNTRLNPRTNEIAFATILEDLSRVFGVDRIVDELGAAEAFFRVFRRRLRAFPDARPTLERLRARGIRVGVFTDVPYGMPKPLVAEDVATSGLTPLLDVLVTSVEVGHRKPSGATLTSVARALACEPCDLVYVGNERKDCEVARVVGCRAVVIHRSGEAPPWGQDQSIGSLADLLATRPGDSD